MKVLRALLMRLFGIFGSRRAERELSDEIESHIQLHADDNIRAGMSPAEARRRAVIALGGVEGTKEAYRDRRGVPAFESLVRDLRYGARTLVKSPGFAIAGIVILGLGIGVNTAIFTVVNAVVFKPLPFADADRIMRLWHTPPQSTFAGMEIFALSPANFVDWEAQSSSFEKMAIYRGGRYTVTGQGDPESIDAIRASASFLPIFGASPIIGRGFTPEEDGDEVERTVILSDHYWRTRYGADPGVLGKTVTLNRVPHVVIGVVQPPAIVAESDAWVPLRWDAKTRAERANHNYRAVAKLKPGVSVQQAQADLTAISDRLALQYPDDNKDWGALVRPLQEDLIGDVRSPLMVLLGAVALVLLIACANLANLMLVRTHGRAKEIALRGALGASRLRVIQQLLAEGVVLGAGGGLVGFAAAYFGVDVLKAAFGTALPRANEIVVDTQVLGFTAAIAIAAGLVAAFAPAWQLTGRDANEALKTGPGRGSSSGDGRVRNLLVVSEVALALMLLIGAGLLMRSLISLRGVDPGFDAARTWTGTIDIPEAKYATPEVRNQFFERVVEDVRALPGVQSAAWIDTIPLDGGGSTQYVVVEGQPAMKDSELPVVAVRLSSPGYFATAKIPLRSGRDFTEADGLGRQRVVIVSEKTAERFFPGQDPIGRHITLKMMTPEPAEIVGVVREVKLGSLDASAADSETAVYAPAAQFGYNGSTLVARTAGEPGSLTRSILSVVRRIDPEQPVLNVQTMEAVVEQSLGQRPLAMLLLAAFAALALVLATVGIYSVLAYTVRQRVREIGIRMALGAPVKGLLGMIVVEGLKPTLVGVTLGLVLAAALVRVMETLLFGVSRYDPGTFAIVAIGMLAVGIVATLLPAYRATRVDPIVTLRAE